MSTDIETVEGKVLDGSRFPNLYRLLDLERSAVEEAQKLTMPAAFEILEAYESGEWRQDKVKEHEAEIARTNLQPRWSPTTKEAFYAWIRERAERDGHPARANRTIEQLKDAADCVRIVQSTESKKARAAARTLTEDAWRPAVKLLNMGYHKQIAAVVERAAELAEEQGKPITQKFMSVARSEIWNTDPEIRQWVEQPGQTVDPRSAHDRVVTALNRIRKEANDLRRQLGDNPKAWKEFLAGLAEIQ